MIGSPYHRVRARGARGRHRVLSPALEIQVVVGVFDGDLLPWTASTVAVLALPRVRADDLALPVHR